MYLLLTSAKYTSLRSKSKDGFPPNHDIVSAWSDMSLIRLLFNELAL